MQTPQPTVIAYPVTGNSPTRMNPSTTAELAPMDPNYFSLGMDSSFSSDIDLGGNFFSQLDSMIQAVKVESTALDSMRDKLKEVDNLRSQISAFTKRLIEADQSNLNLKAQLVKSQEAYAELKKSKAEVESNMVPLRQELNRTKEMFQKERQIRQQIQQELAMVKEQAIQISKVNENLDRECKQIPVLQESNEMLKNDLEKLRKRYKEEKQMMQKHIKNLEIQCTNMEVYKQEVRNVAIRLMEVTGAGGGVGAGGQLGQQGSNVQGQQQGVLGGPNGGPSGGGSHFIAGNAINLRNLQQQQQQVQAQQQAQQQQMMYNNSNSSNVNDSYEDDDDYYEDNGMNNSAMSGDSDYDNSSFIDDTHSLHMMNHTTGGMGGGVGGNVGVGSSLESMSMSSLLGGGNGVNNGGGGVGGGNGNGGSNGQQQQQQKKKKKVKRVVSNSAGGNGGGGGGGGGNGGGSGAGGGGGGGVHMMQALPSQGNNGTGFMLPRIH